jgi:hypothetical protein
LPELTLILEKSKSQRNYAKKKLLNQSKASLPVMESTNSFGPGPTARTVLDPAATC